MSPCQSGLFDPKPSTPPAAQVSITGSRPLALPRWEMQGLAATGYRYRNIQDTDRTQKLILISGVLSLHKLKAMKKAAAQTISTVKDLHNVEGCTKAEAIAAVSTAF